MKTWKASQWLLTSMPVTVWSVVHSKEQSKNKTLFVKFFFSYWCVKNKSRWNSMQAYYDNDGTCSLPLSPLCHSLSSPPPPLSLSHTHTITPPHLIHLLEASSFRFQSKENTQYEQKVKLQEDQYGNRNFWPHEFPREKPNIVCE